MGVGARARRARRLSRTQTLTITPSSPTREYGGVDDLSYTVSGLVDGDAAGAVVSGALSRAAGSDAGTYAIGMGTLAIATAYSDKYTLPVRSGHHDLHHHAQDHHGRQRGDGAPPGLGRNHGGDL